ncbi:hypothetical protein [Amycolatopsis alkalitolerans]|uniref:Uncharacterized protein n=1 Tax=Amycolatopsis alkalitolerans TaxID=2547244 RepID=A0A5C4M752_9PSEU|nr:hypothetical protein [Amycolatopsis alkalitolerans]TNC29197.1 hypothetical protein FG385_03700 [Amycolatopsis alkalitolerans]
MTVLIGLTWLGTLAGQLMVVVKQFTAAQRARRSERWRRLPRKTLTSSFARLAGVVSPLIFGFLLGASGSAGIRVAHHDAGEAKGLASAW